MSHKWPSDKYYLGTYVYRSELAVNKSFWLRERMALAPLQRHLPIKGEDSGACDHASYLCPLCDTTSLHSPSQNYSR